MSHPGVIRWAGLVTIIYMIPVMLLRVSNNVTLSINTARQHGIEKCVEKMINFSDQLRRLKVDHYEYVSMKVIVLLTSGRSTQNYSLMFYSPSCQMQVAWKLLTRWEKAKKRLSMPYRTTQCLTTLTCLPSLVSCCWECQSYRGCVRYILSSRSSVSNKITGWQRDAMPQPETQGGWKSWIQLPDGTSKGRPLRRSFYLGT